MTENRDDVFLDGTGWEGGDEWIRAQFAVYIHALLAATLQLGKQHTATFLPINFCVLMLMDILGCIKEIFIIENHLLHRCDNYGILSTWSKMPNPFLSFVLDFGFMIYSSLYKDESI